MPLYEYRCETCDHRFETLVRSGEQPTCPSCAGVALEKLMSTFAVADGARRDPAPSGCGRCGDPRGPGACRS